MRPEDTDWLMKVGWSEWEVTKRLAYRHLWLNEPDRVEWVEVGTRTDLASMVPNGEHEEVLRNHVLHDELRKRYPREIADALYLTDFNRAAAAVYYRLLREGKSEREALRELRKINRMGAIYYLAVSGKPGSVYIALQKLGGWFKKLF